MFKSLFLAILALIGVVFLIGILGGNTHNSVGDHDEGQGLAEYGLIVALIAVVVAGVILGLEVY